MCGDTAYKGNDAAPNTAEQDAAYAAAHGGAPAADPNLFGTTIQRGVKAIKANMQFENVPHDALDALVRQAGSGRVMKARMGSTKNSFFAQAFNGPFNAESILGSY
jgi:hypothetical protein